MEAKINLIDPLMERVERYGRTSIELIKLKAVDKTAEMSSVLISRVILYGIVMLFLIMLNIALGFYLGTLAGETYMGFLAVAIFYMLIAIVVYFSQPQLKARLNRSIITKMLD